MFPPLESTSAGSPSTALRALSARAQPLSSGPRAPSPSNGAQREGADAMQSLQLAMDSLDTSLKAALGERRARNDEIVSSLPPPSSHSLTQEKLGGAGNLEVRGGGTVDGGGGTVDGGGGSLFHLQARSLSGNLMTSLRSPSPSPPPPPNKLAASSRPPHGWINQLVKYTEAHPVPVHLMPPPPASPSPVPSSSYELIDAMPSSAYGALAPVAAVAAGFTVAMIPDPTAGSPLHQGQGQGGQQLTPRLRPPSMLPNLNPNPNPNEQGKAPPATSSTSQQEPGRLWGSRREDVMLLATWLDGMMNKVLSPQKGRPHSKNSSAIRQLHQQISMRASVPLDFEQGGLASSPIEQSEGALHIYKVAFDELRRQISIDCKERGELLSILWDRSLSLTEVRVHFEAEERFESMQSLFAEAIIEKEDLEKNMKEMEKVASITLEGHQTALGGADMKNRSLALKLAQAQTLATEMERKRRLADMTLSNEVQRRLEVDEELGTAKKLAIKTEHDMLHFRAANKRLEDKVTHLKAQLVESKRESELSREATRSAEKELSVRMHGRADDEVALARAKRDLETDEILVASYKQQVKELEAQSIQLRSLIRDQALMLSDATVRKDDVQIKLEELEKVLDEEKKGRLSSERLHTDASEKLEKTAGLLEKTRLDLANTIAKSNHDLKIERDRVADLELGEKQLENRLQDMTRRFEGKEDEWLVLKKELEAAREMVAMIAQTLRVQGLEGVPPPVDKSWEQMGPLGAMQRTLPVVQRQLEAVYEGREALRVDLGAVSERLESEIDVQKDLRQQIHESKLIEAKTMRSQEEVETKLAVSEGQTRQLTTDRDQLATHLKVEEAKVKDLRSKLSHEQSRVSHLTPFEPKYYEAEAARLDLKERLENMTDAYESASADVKRMFDGQEALKRELASLVAANHNLTEQTKKMAVLQNELEEMTMLRDTAKREMHLTGDRLERALILQATTSQQLNTAKFLLMGLSLDDEHEAYTSKMAAASSPAPPLPSEPSTRILQNPPRGTLHEDPSEPSTSAPGSPSRLPKSQGGSRWYEAKVYGVSIGAEQLAMMEERGLSSNIIKSKDNWTMLKIKMLAYFSSRLRKKLMEETMLRARLEVEMLEREAAFLEEAKLREDFILQEMVVHMKSHADRVRQEILSELWDLRGILPDVKSLLGKLTSSSALISATLTKLRTRLEDVKSATTQTGAEVEPAWAAFTQDIPKDLERISPLSPTSVVEAIVRVYMRQEGTIAPDLVLQGKGTAWGVARNDTIHDALMAHYQSLSLTPGTFNAEHIAGSNGPVARLLISCLPLQEYTKVASFLFFLGLSTSHAGVKWSQESWHFFLHVLHGIRLLLAGAWRATIKEWSTLKGALIPLQAAQDLLGNLYNVNDPAELEGAVSRRLSALIVPGQAGASVDLDAFLLLLMNEFNEGNCPRQALFNPRRVTDSFLGNTANVAGSGVAHTTGVTHSLATAGSGVSVGVAANPRSQSPNPRCQSPMSSSSKY